MGVIVHIFSYQLSIKCSLYLNPVSISRLIILPGFSQIPLSPFFLKFITDNYTI